MTQYGKVGEETFNTWCQLLSDLTCDELKAGFRGYVQSGTEYAPNVMVIRKHANAAKSDQFPPAKLAYVEACQKAVQPHHQDWSHRVVYLAGRETGWFNLRTQPEKEIYSLYARNYEVLCRRITNGEDVEVVIPQGLPEKVERPLSKAENSRRMKNLIDEMGL
ncbi:hypothetical protein HBA55_29525 [Pseudomaricurvus alkylphenolicus]|uniref:hypothetical protein n=1 Tax=Pseudomaricurvus alkylphenolicus TaxID=1306991 RepID=UPI00141DA085|nr:hypothetical protein [Pseudomaricurvus alkylphenolicus]NIB43779.1 hypothetical protein [Pseudomaricurvus alkylphenolicus]